MNRRSLLVIAIALVGVVTIGVIAGTVSSTTISEDDGGQRETPGDGGDGGSVDGWEFWGFPSVPAVLLWPVLILGFVGGLAYAARHRKPLLAVTLVGAVLIYLVFVLDAQPDISTPTEGNGPPPPQENESSGGGGSSSPSEENPTSILWAVAPLVAVFVLFVGLAVASSRSSEQEDDDQPAAQPEAEAETDELGEIAGRAADQIEESETDDFENEVYRAWQEMTQFLDVQDPDTTTPRQFADAASRAGINPDDADELTALFEDVRYGGYTPTEETEQRAVEILRRIERTYAGSEK